MKGFKHFEVITIQQLDNGFYLAFLTDFRDLIAVFTPEKLGVAELMSAFEKDLVKLQDYVARSYKFAESEDLLILDTQRDDIFSFIYQTIKTSLKSTEAASKASAKILSAVMSAYYNKNTTRYAYEKESSYIDGFLLDAAKPENTPHFATLGLSNSLALLKTVQADFTAKYKARVTSKEAVYAEKTVELRKDTDIHYQRITDFIFAKSLIEPSDDITKFMDNWNFKVKDFKNAISSTGKRKKDETPATKPESSTGETPVVTDDKNGVNTSGRPPSTETTETVKTENP